MEQLLQQAPDVDAVFVASDLMAAGALTVLHRAGRRVPEDVAVGGFDDSHILPIWWCGTRPDFRPSACGLGRGCLRRPVRLDVRRSHPRPSRPILTPSI
jgi:Periplasmic binding protein-like domain